MWYNEVGQGVGSGILYFKRLNLARANTFYFSLDRAGKNWHGH